MVMRNDRRELQAASQLSNEYYRPLTSYVSNSFMVYEDYYGYEDYVGLEVYMHHKGYEIYEECEGHDPYQEGGARIARCSRVICFSCASNTFMRQDDPFKDIAKDSFTRHFSLQLSITHL